MMFIDLFVAAKVQFYDS